LPFLNVAIYTSYSCYLLVGNMLYKKAYAAMTASVSASGKNREFYMTFLLSSATGFNHFPSGAALMLHPPS